MSNAQDITIGYGKTSFGSSNSTLALLKVSAPFTTKLPNAGKTKPNAFPASVFPDINGNLYRNTISEVADGTVFVAQYTVRKGASPLRDGAVFIAARSTGPLILVNALLAQSRESILGDTHVMFYGRGDILRVDELSEFGISPDKRFQDRYMDMAEIDECFSIDQVAAGYAARPKVEMLTTSSGEVAAVISKPQRVLRLRGVGRTSNKD